MKKTICILLSFIMLLSFAACTPKPKTENPVGNNEEVEVIPVVGDRNLSKEFKDENGKVVFVVEACFPSFTENYSGETNLLLDDYYDTVFKEACDFAESNIDNASKFMEERASDAPWKKTYSYELKYIDTRFLNIKLYEAFSIMDGDPKPTFTTQCFDFKYYGQCDSIYDFAADKDDPTNEDCIINEIFDEAKMKFYSGLRPLDESAKEKFRENFDPYKFYFTDEKVYFCFDCEDIDENYSGDYICTVPWILLNTNFYSPKTLIAIDKEDAAREEAEAMQNALSKQDAMFN